MKRLVIALAALVSVAATKAPPAPPSPEGVQSVQPAPAGSYPYLLYVPKGYDADATKHWPLLIFLHGSGERGNDLQLVKKNGPPKVVERQTDAPFLLVSPQLELDGIWDSLKLDRLLIDLRKRYRVDASRIYLTGLSLGGMGAWEWAMRRPELFAALVPVAGRSEPAHACQLKDMPVWAFHGDSDPVVDPIGSFAMVQAVRACRGNVAPRLTIYPATGHASWEPAYDDPAMWRWLLDQRRATPAPDSVPMPPASAVPAKKKANK